MATAKKRKHHRHGEEAQARIIKWIAAGCTSSSGGPRTAQQTLDLITTLTTTNAAA